MDSLQLCISVICLAICALAQQEPIPETFPKAFDQQAFDFVGVWDYINEQTKEGYRYGYQTLDNSIRQQEGKILYPDTDKDELVVTGTYSYVYGDYKTVVEYIADRNGYRSKVLVRVIPPPSGGGISPRLLKSLTG